MNTGARTARGSVGTYRSVATSGKLTTATVAAAPPYVAPQECP
jgi:hypothetical protein